VLYCVHAVLCSVLCRISHHFRVLLNKIPLHTALCAVSYSLLYALYTVHCIMYTLNCMMYAVHCTHSAYYYLEDSCEDEFVCVHVCVCIHVCVRKFAVLTTILEQYQFPL
jgi:hypothetical protein